MSTKLSTLSTLKRKAITALLAQPTVTAAAEHAGCSRNALYKWLAEDEAFQNELAKRESVIINEATRKLCRLADEAIDTLHQAMVGEDASPAVRVRAANHVLGHLLRLRELDGIEQRLSRLESLYENN